jgi:hypothetical protein
MVFSATEMPPGFAPLVTNRNASLNASSSAFVNPPMYS